MRYLLLLSLFFSFSAQSEIIRIELLQEPCQNGCSEKLESMFKTHASFSKAHVISKYKFIELHAIEWVQDAKLREMVRSHGYYVVSITRTPN